MHIRFTSCIGTPVLEEGGEHALGALSGILLDPDTGKIEGFFVDDLFCSALDIVRWGTRVYLRDSSVLAPPEDRIRLQPLLGDPRSVLGQKIRTESGASLGRCADIQFNTDAMHIEWIFPRKFFRWGIALPVADVLEVTPAAIIIRDPMNKERVSKRKNVQEGTLPDIELQNTPAGRGV